MTCRRQRSRSALRLVFHEHCDQPVMKEDESNTANDFCRSFWQTRLKMQDMRTGVKSAYVASCIIET